MWCTQVGYNSKEIADAISAQALRLCYNSPWYSINGPASALAKRISELAPGDLNHTFFTTGGSSAVDSALRFMQFYNNVLGRPNKRPLSAASTAIMAAHTLPPPVRGVQVIALISILNLITSRSFQRQMFSVALPA